MKPLLTGKDILQLAVEEIPEVAEAMRLVREDPESNKDPSWSANVADSEGQFGLWLWLSTSKSSQGVSGLVRKVMHLYQRLEPSTAVWEKFPELQPDLEYIRGELLNYLSSQEAKDLVLQDIKALLEVRKRNARRRNESDSAESERLAEDFRHHIFEGFDDMSWEDYSWDVV